MVGRTISGNCSRCGIPYGKDWTAIGHLLGIALKKHTNSGKKDNATPLFDWGKYYEKNGKIMIPISVQVHHSFVDGMHVGQFVADYKYILI